MTPTLLALSTLVLHRKRERERCGCAAGLNASDVKNSCGKSQWNAVEMFCVGQLCKSASSAVLARPKHNAIHVASRQDRPHAW